MAISGPKIFANSWIEKANVFRIFHYVSLQSTKYKGLSSFHLSCPKVYNTAGKLKAQWKVFSLLDPECLGSPIAKKCFISELSMGCPLRVTIKGPKYSKLAFFTHLELSFANFL